MAPGSGSGSGNFVLGSTGRFFASIYVNQIWLNATNSIYAVGSTNVVFSGQDVVTTSNCRPYGSNSGYSGTSGNAWYQGYSYVGWSTTSDEKEKLNLTDCDLGLDFVMQLKPKKWKWKNGKTDDYHYGLVYQDVDKLDKNNDFGFLHPSEEYEELETNEKKMSNNAMTYHQLTAPLILAIQEQQKQIDELKKLINKLIN